MSATSGARRLGVALLTLLLACVPALALALSTPPPTPVPPNGSPSPFPTVLHTPRASPSPPSLKAGSAILEDLDTGQVLFAENPSRPRPVASLTKVMTALLVLERARPEDLVTVSALAASQGGSSLGLAAGERISVRDLLYALLLQSSNDAAVALAESVSGSVPAFVDAMNARARELGLHRTTFAGPSGLDDRGRSTAFGLAAVTRAAFAHPLFERIVATKFRDIPAPVGPPRHIQNRNALLWLYPGAIGVKTGFTTPAGHSLIAAATGGSGLRVLAVVLGDPSEQAEFNEGATLLDYGLHEFRRVTLVRRGERFEHLAMEGRDLVGVAGADLLALVRIDLVAGVVRTFRPAANVVLPLLPGQAMGREEVRSGSILLGRVLMVSPVLQPAASAPPPARAPESAPSWTAPVSLLASMLRALAEGYL